MLPTHALAMQPSRAWMRAVPVRLPNALTDQRAKPAKKEEHRAHTITQRLRTLKKIPPELIPLGIVLGVAIGAACYSLGNKLVTDKTLRLSRTNRSENFK